uniref:Uncharacterized protein n=1 Tax=Romanomermis culicivorax TaxID=13658 RepID=A0A915KAI4_ROMCU
MPMPDVRKHHAGCKQLASHLWNIFPQCARAQWTEANQQLIANETVTPRDGSGHLCFMQPVGNEQIKEEDVFETNDKGVNDDNTRLTMQEKILRQMELGDIFEVWHYNNIEQYHPTKNPDDGLFPQYVNTFMKMKLESEGYPARAQMDEQKREYKMEVYN